MRRLLFGIGVLSPLCLIAIVITYFLFVNLWEIQYPDLDNIDCFIPSEPTSNAPRLTLRNRETTLDVFDTSNMLLMSIEAVHGLIAHPVLSPDGSLLVFAEVGTTLSDATIIRACDFDTGVHVFYILDLSPINALTIPEDGVVVMTFSNGGTREYRYK